MFVEIFKNYTRKQTFELLIILLKKQNILCYFYIVDVIAPKKSKIKIKNMKSFPAALLLFLLLTGSQVSMAQVKLKNSIDSLSYAIGLNVGENLKAQKVNANADLLAQAIKDLLSNSKTLITSESANTYIQSYFQNEYMKKAETNKKTGEDFLAANKVKPGIITTASGLQYKILTAGTGAKPAATDKVKVHYHGYLIDGTVFDSSVNRGEPASFGIDQVIPGWIEGLQLMPAGSKWQIFVPADLAYGPQGPPSIGPNQVLIFDVELLEIIK